MTLPLSYSLRNVRARPTRSLMTAGVIALVVVACSLFLGLISSLRRTLVSSGDPRNLVVMRKGSDNDGASQLSLEAYQAIRYFDGIARDARDQPLASPELVVQPFFHTLDGGRENVLVRGVEPVALQVHDDVRLTGRPHVHAERGARRWSARGVVGTLPRRDARQRARVRAWRAGRWSAFSNRAARRSRARCGSTCASWPTTPSGPFPTPASACASPTAADMAPWRAASTTTRASRWPRSVETDYYAKQSESANSLYILVIGIAVLAGIGAGFGAANTMYAAVQARTAEIGTLRAWAFRAARFSAAFEVEAMALSAVGFAIGAVRALGCRG